MRIGLLARAAGVTVQTVRFYERRGLITAPARRDSGYRDYPENAVDEIRTVSQLKSLGFTLGEVHAAIGNHADDDELCRISAEKVVTLESEIRRLTEVLNALNARRRSCGCDREQRFQSIKGRSA